VAIAVTNDLPGMTAEQYDGFMSHIQGQLAAAPGLLAHTAGPRAGGWQVFELWQSEQDFTNFVQQVMVPLAAAAGMTLPHPRIDHLHRVLAGGAPAGTSPRSSETPLHVSSNEGEAFRLGPLELLVKEDGRHTREMIAVAEFRGSSFRIPPHTHTEHDETIYIVEGELTVSLGDEIFVATAGTSFTVPINVPHSVWNETGKQARFLNTIVPARYLDYFHEMALASKDSLPGRDVMQAIMGKYGLRPVQPAAAAAA
jgi:mannose-6-phosphate isomerase-like protein (cupin superfamily)